MWKSVPGDDTDDKEKLILFALLLHSDLSARTHVLTNVYTRLLTMHMSIHTHMSAHMSIHMSIHTSIHVYTHVYIPTHVLAIVWMSSMRACAHSVIAPSRKLLGASVLACVCGHVCRHVYRHAYRHPIDGAQRHRFGESSSTETCQRLNDHPTRRRSIH